MADVRIPRVALVTKYDWPEWYKTLRGAAEYRRIWQYIDPEAPTSDYLTERPVKPSYVAPPESEAKNEEALEVADRTFTRELEVYSVKTNDWNTVHHHYLTIVDWVNNTVRKEYLWAAESRIDEQPNTKKTLQNLLKELKNQYEPLVKSAVREHYHAVLASALKGGIAPKAWHQEFMHAHSLAMDYKIPEVEGNFAARMFLNAVGERLAPQWAQNQLDDFVEAEVTGKDPLKLLELSAIFMEQVGSGTLPGAEQPSFAALGGAGVADQDSSSANGKPRCPCNLRRPHKWKPTECRRLEYAVRGSAGPLKDERAFNPIPQSEVKKILERLKDNKWKSLRNELDKLGWTNNSTDELTSHVSGVVINPSLFQLDTPIDLAVETRTGPHTLSQSTVVGSCGSSHIVNDLSMLQEGSFVPAPPGRVVEAGSLAFSIRGTGTRVIKEALLGVGGVKLDLTLRNVDLVEGFHTNIISEALLNDASVWYCGKDCTLRVGSLTNNAVVRQLQRVGNLVFMEYKPLYSSYSVAPQLSEGAPGV